MKPDFSLSKFARILIPAVFALGAAGASAQTIETIRNPIGPAFSA